jgi:DNA-binding PucR family transcriptional regulator
LCLLVGEHGGQLIVVVGGSGAPSVALDQVAAGFPPGPVVIGPMVRELTDVVVSVAEARAGLAAVPAWPSAPRPVASSALLAERALLGDDAARQRLRREVYEPLVACGQDQLRTTSAFLDEGGAVEATARRLFLHPNTVRYRLRKVTEAIGHDVAQPRDAQVVRMALVIGRAAGAE